MPTELRDAWPEDENPVLTNIERNVDVSARKVQQTEDDNPNLAYIEEMLDHIHKEQSQRLTILTLVFGMLMLCQINCIESLRRETRRLAASQRFPS